MPVYLLKPHDAVLKFWPDLDSVLGAVVVADSEEAARALAVAVAKVEGPDVWRDSELTSCSVVDPAGSAGVVLVESHGF